MDEIKRCKKCGDILSHTNGDFILVGNLCYANNINTSWNEYYINYQTYLDNDRYAN